MTCTLLLMVSMLGQAPGGGFGGARAGVEECECTTWLRRHTRDEAARVEAEAKLRKGLAEMFRVFGELADSDGSQSLADLSAKARRIRAETQAAQDAKSAAEKSLAAIAEEIERHEAAYGKNARHASGKPAPRPTRSR